MTKFTMYQVFCIWKVLSAEIKAREIRHNETDLWSINAYNIVCVCVGWRYWRCSQNSAKDEQQWSMTGYYKLLIDQLMLLVCIATEMHHWSSFYRKWSTTSIMTYGLQYCSNLSCTFRSITATAKILSTNRKCNIENKKALLSQRRPRDAPNVWVPWKVSRVLANAPGYFSRNL